MASQSFNLNLNINANANSAQNQLKNLQKQLQDISNMKIDLGTSNLTADIEKASEAAMKLSAHLATATNPQTGNLDFTKFYTSIQKSGASLEDYGKALQNMGPAGQKAFVSLADSISKAEIPLRRTSKLVDGMWDNLKKTVGWQLSSSMVHGFIGHIQKAMGYAQDLNKSLTDIRIVTGQSTEQMAQFAREANRAAKDLSTTTTQYTKASLIYYQQGLSDAEVKERAETTIKMANVTGTSAQKVSDQMTAVWNNFDNGTKSLTHYADVMTALGAATASSTDEIAQGLQKFAAISDTVGLSYEYAATALATITSTSRESADVVGNSLKTLFTRIQGLQLGETLDDGTTLNKYSTALAKVGISIKDSSGELKDMDLILNEMGEKWQTLARDEQMALAQTVAGVRQYTQLMTLMENWDTFKQNLNIANASQGTLDSQAAIYAESWEAASNRVRASWEGLWDTMIDSDSMVNLLDFFSGFIDILDTMAQSAGGVTGVLTSFLGIATKIFSPQLTRSVSNMAYGIGMMFGGQAKMESARLGILKDAYNSLSQDSAFGALYGTEESKARQQAMKDQLAASINYAENKTHMTPFQQLMEQHYASQQQAHNEARIQAAARYDTAKEQASDAYWDMYDKDDKGKLFNHLDQRLLSQDEENTRRQLENYASHQNLNASGQAQLQQLNLRSGTVDDVILKQQKALAKFSNTMNNLGTIKADERVTAFNEAVQTFTKESGQNIDETIMARLQEQVSQGQLTEATNGVNRLGQTIRDNLATQIANDLDIAEDNTEMRDKIRNRINSVYNRESSYLGIPGELSQKEREENQKQSKIQAGAQAAVSGAQGLISTVSMIQSLEGLQQQLDAVGDGAGSVIGVLSSLASALMSGAMGFNGLNSALTAMKVPAGAAAGWAAAIMLALVAITAIAKEIDKNNISEKERIKTLQQSDAELNNATESSKKLIETYKTQNDNYNESIEKIKTNMTNPDQLVNDIFYANKQAMELISEYGLKENQYSKNSMGLIEIDQKVLDSQVEAMEKANIDLQRTSALSGATTQKELAEIEIQNLLDKSGQYTPRSSGTYTSSYLKDTEEYQQAQKTRYYFGDEEGNKWTFEDAVKAYGTEEWNKAKDFAEANGQKQIFKDLEQQILEYQEANNLLNLAARNNVDYLLKSQEYTLDGAETFAALAYDDYKKKYNEEYNNGKFSKDNLSSLNDDQKNQIKKYLEAQGYTEIENINFDGSDTSKFTFDHSEGEGSVNVEAVRKWDAEQAAASATQETFDASFDVLQHLTSKDAKTAPGLMSLLTGDNFVNTTIGEMEAAKTAVSQISKDLYNTLYDGVNEDGTAKLREGLFGTDADIDKFMKENFGLDTKAFKDLFNIGDNVNLVDWFKTFENYTSKAQRLISGEPLLDQWLNGKGNNDTFGERIRDNLNQGTLTSLYDSFKKASLLGGTDAGQAMIKGITEVLQDSNLDESDWDQAIQGLLAIDWSNTLTSGGAAASVISSLGGELDTTTAAWEAFAAAMAAAAGAMPDFSGLISQLTQLAGALQGLSKGETISADIRDQLVAMNPEFADLFSKHYSGDYTFIGNDNGVLKEATWDQMLANKSQAKQITQDYSNYISGNGKGQKDNDDIGRSDFTSHYIPGVGYFVNSTHASQLGKIAGYDFQTQSNILNNYDAAKGILNLWDIGKSTDIGVARHGQNGGFDLYNKETGNWENIVDTADARYQQILSEFETDQTAYNTAKNIMDTMFGSIHNLDEVSGNWDSGEIESLLSTMDSAKDIFTASTKFDFLRDEHGALNDSTLKAIQAMPETSERASVAIDQLVASKENLYRVEQELHDELAKGTMSEEEAEAAMNNAILAYEQAEANAALQSSIDAVAEARGLDAEAVAFYAEQIQNSLSAEDEATLGANNIADMAADLAEQQEAINGLNNEWSKLSQIISQTDMTLDKSKALNSFADYIDKLTNSSLTAGKSVEALNKSWQQFKNMGGDMSKVLKGDIKEITKLARAFGDMEKKVIKVNKEGKNYGKTYEQMFEQVDNALGKLKNPKEESVLGPEDFIGDPAEQQAAYDDLLDAVYDTLIQEMADNGGDFEAAAEKVGSQFGVNIGKGVKEGEQAEIGDGSADVVATPTDGEASNLQPEVGQPGEESWISWFCFPSLCGEHFIHVPVPGTASIPAPKSTAPKKSDLALTLRPDAPPKSSGGGGGGGGGGGAKEPKKVAIKRKSETVQRYKQNDYKASVAQKAKKSEEHKKDYLYGERKIEQLEKINRLTAKEAHITADRIKESREYLIEDRQNLIKMLSKYGFEAEFDTDGFLANYEKVWNELYKEIAALYEDNLLTEEEEKIEEEYNIKLEELEGALQDYENSLKELADDIEKYEESLFEIYDTKVEALEHKVEFKIELEEDDLAYLDFWIDTLGDSVYNAIESIEAMGAKANHLFDGLNVYKQGIEDIYALSDDPFQIWATGGLEDVLTQDQVDLLRDNRDGLADYMQQLIDLREDIKDKVIDTFDLWQERIDANIASLEHYTSVLEHFKNIVDTVGKDPFGLSDQFVNAMEQSAINQSMDGIEANKAYYESLQEQQLKAQEELNAARERGDESSAEHWEEVVRTTTEAVEEAQDAMLSSLEDTLTMIAEQFENAMQRAVDSFNDAIYAYGGLEGLANDYEMIRENADLMAADYEKIYQLSKLTRDINKVLDDTTIIAGKQKMNNLLKEINKLQAEGVELSKYDVEYLQAKYELRLAEIELENAQNSKDTVRLSRDSEGNWAYIYTQNEESIAEAEQKYEDALYEMQVLSQEYLEEMSGMMLETSQAMMEEISALRIQDFTSYEAYQSEVKRIQDKYAESLKFQENELNKSINNSADLYEEDWKNYNILTGYKISAAENWVDTFKESTIGTLLSSESIMSSFSDTFLGLTDQMSESLAEAAVQYFTNVDVALGKYGTSIDKFNITIRDTMDNITSKSKDTTSEIKTMATEMSNAFKEIADYVSGWQEDFSTQIDETLEDIKTLIQEINEAIRTSAELTEGKSGAGKLIGSKEAVRMLNEAEEKAGYDFGEWKIDDGVGIKVDGKATNFVDYNAALIEEIDEAVARYANTDSESAERAILGEELKELFKRYWYFRDIVNSVYDPTNLTTNMKAPNFSKFDTGGYTGEWGDSGKFAMLHEKELVLNANDTANFLEALNISRQIIEMIEMNAKASSLGLGDLVASTIKDNSQTIEQQVSITAEFPNVTDRSEIEEAFDNLINMASQYAYREN